MMAAWRACERVVGRQSGGHIHDICTELRAQYLLYVILYVHSVQYITLHTDSDSVVCELLVQACLTNGRTISVTTEFFNLKLGLSACAPLRS